MDAPKNSHKRGVPKEQVVVSVVHVKDPTAAGDTVEVLDQDIVSLGELGFEAKRVSVPFEESCLLYQWTNSRLRTQTRVHEDFDSVIVLGPKARGSIDGAELAPHSMIAASKGASAEIIVEGGYESIALMVPPQVLEKHLAMRGGPIDFAISDGHAVWRPDVEKSEILFELGVNIASAAEETPAVFDDSHWARYGAQVEFMDALLSTIESCVVDETVEVDKKGKSYSQIVRTCEEYTMNVEGHRPYVSELCAAAHVSERTLQYAFKDIMGMSPVTYLHRLRLHRARNELRQADTSSTTVTDVAMNWGFWHFGAFSQAYKNCFGEVPSKTLRQESSSD
jgi:AraC family ethanolamine operon transcriptional activator